MLAIYIIMYAVVHPCILMIMLTIKKHIYIQHMYIRGTNSRTTDLVTSVFHMFYSLHKANPYRYIHSSKSK